MSEPTGEKRDRYTAPSDTELSVLSSALLQKIRQAIDIDKLYNLSSVSVLGDDNSWVFDIEGVGALTDDSGYIPTEELFISVEDALETSTTRSFSVFSVKTLESDPDNTVSEAYIVDLQKNTQIVTKVSRAGITTQEQEALLQDYQAEISAALSEDPEESDGAETEQPGLPHSLSSMLRMLIHTRRATLRLEDQMQQLYENKLRFGACNRGEVILLTETLQRATPKRTRRFQIG